MNSDSSQNESKVMFVRLGNAKGLDVKRIRCEICRCILPLRDCYTCIDCNKSFCKECSSYKDTCKCGLKHTNLNPEFYNLLGEIEISCKNSECEQQILYKNLQSHEIECPFSPIICVCQQLFLRKDRDLDESQCKELIKVCPKCQFSARRIEYKHNCVKDNFI